MRGIRIVVALLLLALASRLVYAEDAHALAARKAIQARYDQMNKAVMQKDFKTIEATYSPNCVLKEAGERRTMPVRKFLQQVKGLLPVTTVLSAKTPILSIKAVKGGYETVAEWKGESMFNKSFQGSKELPREPRKVKQTVHDIWKKTDKGWQITQRTIEN